MPSRCRVPRPPRPCCDNQRSVAIHPTGETRAAFQCNVALYTEEGALWSGAARGVGNMVSGFARAKLLG